MIPSGNDIKLALTTISDLVKKGMTLEAQEKIMDLREMVQGLREQCVELKEENMLLKKKLEEKESVFFENGVYWTKKEDGTKEGPFCVLCHDNLGKLIRLKDDGYQFECFKCHFKHQYKEYPIETAAREARSRGRLF